MLNTLKIKNIAIIDEVEIEFGAGLNLLTGETGAGKSILIDAIGLILGNKASTDLIRTGEKSAVVEACFSSQDGSVFLRAKNIECVDDEIVIHRELSITGRNKTTINGSLVPLAMLRELSAHLAALHGQHEPQGLLEAQRHIEILDRHCEHEPAVDEIGELYTKTQAIDQEIAKLYDNRRELERRREMLAYEIAEIERAELIDDDEEEKLNARREICKNADRILALSTDAYALLYEDEHSAIARVVQAFKRIEDLAGFDATFKEHLDSRNALVAQLEDVAFHLRERLQDSSIREIKAHLARCQEEIQRCSNPEQLEKSLREERQRLVNDYWTAARKISSKRRTQSKALAHAIQKELSLLAMDKTQFLVRFDPAEVRGGVGEWDASWSPSGLERSEFYITPNPGEEPRPLARVASGGELSRILLAIHAVTSCERLGKTVIFDEVDAGIGGRVAEILGKRLKTIAKRNQVFCVTHLPQIAALADHHFAIAKRHEAARTFVDVHTLDAQQRVEEIARMLGGEKITETTRKHASELLCADAIAS